MVALASWKWYSSPASAQAHKTRWVQIDVGLPQIFSMLAFSYLLETKITEETARR
tara:strand:- start:6825 stop:6989 length:165 start_codon:yes stop_codon:yes gene_type:complete